MKKFLLILTVALSTMATAQNLATTKGKWLVEANTIFGRQASKTGNTSISYASNGDQSEWNFGLQGGYFVIDNLAIVAGLGYGQSEYLVTADMIKNPKNYPYLESGLKEGDTDTKPGKISYKLGAKYYVLGKFPIGLDINGHRVTDDSDKTQNRAWLGLQAGYAWFIAPNVSLEPSVRFNTNLSFGDDNDKFKANGDLKEKDRSNFQGLLGFSFYF